MPKKYKDHTVRTTARIDTDLYNRVVGKLHYGQITVLLTNVFESLARLIKQGKFQDIVLFMNNIKELTLPIKKDKS